MESMLHEIRIPAQPLDKIIENLDEFEWVDLIDAREEVGNVYWDANIQLGVLLCLWNLHLIDYDFYTEWVDKTYKALKQLRILLVL